MQRSPRVVLAITVLALLSACQSTGHGYRHGMTVQGHEPMASQYEPPQALDLKAMSDLYGVVAKVQDKRVVYVGEAHDRLDHHLNQLEIIKGLHKKHKKLAIGMEFFQRPYQQAMDDYSAGRIDEAAFLNKTEYFQRWRMDYRLYRPIIQFARENGIALVALDIATELRHKIGRQGWTALNDQERAVIPAEIDESDKDYEQRMKKIFAWHPEADSGRQFTTFMQAQLTRDEAMAETAADYLKSHPDFHMVILAGAGHLAYGSGIPNRLQRRLPVTSAIILNDIGYETSPQLADYVLLSKQLPLAKAGLMGVGLDDSQGPGVRVTEIAKDSGAQLAGFNKEDRILAINGQDTVTIADIKFLMLDAAPGDKISVKVQYQSFFSGTQTEQRDVVLR